MGNCHPSRRRLAYEQSGLSPDTYSSRSSLMTVSGSNHDLQYLQLHILKVGSNSGSATPSRRSVAKCMKDWAARLKKARLQKLMRRMQKKDFQHAYLQINTEIVDGVRLDLQSPKPIVTPEQERKLHLHDLPVSPVPSTPAPSTPGSATSARDPTHKVKKSRKTRIFPSAEDLSCIGVCDGTGAAHGPKSIMRRSKSVSSFVSPVVRTRSELTRCDKHFVIDYESEILGLEEQAAEASVDVKQLPAGRLAALKAAYAALKRKPADAKAVAPRAHTRSKTVAQDRLVVHITDHHHRAIVGFKDELEETRCFRSYHAPTIVGVFANPPASPASRRRE